MNRNTTTQQSADEVWSAQAEAELFDGLERYPPVGACKYFNVASLAALLRRNAHLHVSPAALWRRLGSLYNLPRLEEEESQEFRAVVKFKPPPPDEDGDSKEEEEEEEEEGRGRRGAAAGEEEDDDDRDAVSSSEEEGAAPPRAVRGRGRAGVRGRAAAAAGAAARGKGRARGQAKEEDEEEEEEAGGSDDDDAEARPAKRARVDRAVSARGGVHRQARNDRDSDEDEEDEEGEGGEEDDDDDDDAMKGEEAAAAGASHGGAVGGSRLAARKEKLEAAFEEMATNSRLKYASFTELIYAALKTLGGSAELQQIYDWVGRDENWRRLDKKYASRFENSSSNYKSNIRSTLYSNSLFVKLDGSTWSIAPTEAVSKGKKGAGKK